MSSIHVSEYSVTPSLVQVVDHGSTTTSLQVRTDQIECWQMTTVEGIEVGHLEVHLRSGLTVIVNGHVDSIRDLEDALFTHFLRAS